jgi:hypothetical protein
MNKNKVWRFTHSLHLLTILFLLSACQPSPATTAAPLLTPQISTEIVPTAPLVLPATLTLAPADSTATATAAPTLTPLPPGATPDPNLGVGATLWDENFDGSSGWKWEFTDPLVTFAIANGQLSGVMTRSDQGWRISGGPDVQAANAQYRLTVRTFLCYEKDEYGLLFRSRANQNFEFSGYLFKLSCGGQARVELLRDNEPSIVLDWIPTPSIQASAPAENTLMVWALNEQLHFYVNERHIGSATDKTFTSGNFDVYLRDRTGGGLSVAYSKLTVKEITAP